jgi:hypothetical protein
MLLTSHNRPAREDTIGNGHARGAAQPARRACGKREMEGRPRGQALAGSAVPVQSDSFVEVIGRVP